MRALLLTSALVVAACGPAAGSAANATAVQPEASRPQCVDGGGDTTALGYFEFQVERPAVARSVPEGPSHPGRNYMLVQFIVDSAGVPEAATVKVIEPALPTTAKLQASVASWRFTPAEAYGCRVRQVVQVPVWRTSL
jgi:hypothetical protein